MLQTETPEVPGRMPLVTPPPAPAPVTPTPSFYLNQQQLQMLQVLQQNAANLNPQQQVKFLSNFMIVITSMEIILYFLSVDIFTYSNLWLYMYFASFEIGEKKLCCTSIFCKHYFPIIILMFSRNSEHGFVMGKKHKFNRGFESSTTITQIETLQHFS